MSEMTQDDMVPMPISEFISGLVVPVDVFLKLSDSKFILLAKAGAKDHKEQLTAYKGKEVDYLWVRKNEYSKITQQNIAIAGVIIKNANLVTRQKTKVLTTAASSVFKELDHLGLSVDTFNHAKQVSDATVAMIENHNDLSALLQSLGEISQQMLRHSMSVSMFSVLIAQAMKWENKLTLEKLALGGMLHDIGLKTLPPDLIDKPKALMSFEEIQSYEAHPFKGVELLRSLSVVPDDIVSIVFEHHENAVGQGYPRKLRDLKMHPLAKVVALANEFCDLIMPHTPHQVAKNPREAIFYIEHTMGQPFNKDAFRGLKIVINQEVQKKDPKNAA